MRVYISCYIRVNILLYTSIYTCTAGQLGGIPVGLQLSVNGQKGLEDGLRDVPLSETECKDDPVLKSKKYIVKHQICGSGYANNVKLKNPVLFFPLQCTLYSTLQY